MSGQGQADSYHLQADIAQIGGDRVSLAIQADRLVPAPHVEVSGTEIDQHLALADPIADPAKRFQGPLMMVEHVDVTPPPAVDPALAGRLADLPEGRERLPRRDCR
jgi:hypothetical protein